MEKNILLIGKNSDTLEILKDELVKFNRNIVYANSEKQISSYLVSKKLDLIIVGVSLPTETRNELVGVIEKTAPEELHIMERTPEITPAPMIGYINEKAVMW